MNKENPLGVFVGLKNVLIVYAVTAVIGTVCVAMWRMVF